MPSSPLIRSLVNPRHGAPGIVVLNAAGFRRARAEITAWPGYAPTPLHSLPAVASQAGVASVHVKDEASRFGLGAVEALGAPYAVLNLVLNELARTGAAPHATAADLLSGRHAAAAAIAICCAAHGGHGLAVAWAAKRFGPVAHVFLPEQASEADVDAIARAGAVVHRTPDADADAAAVRAAAREGWRLVAATASGGDTETPREIMQAYRLSPDEAFAQLSAPPTHILIQGDAETFAAAVSAHARARLSPPAAIIVIEPETAACLLASADAGRLTRAADPATGRLCRAEPCLLAWQELERAAAAFLAIPAAAADDAARRLAAHGIASSQSGAAGLAALTLAAHDPATRAALRLGPAARVLLFNTRAAA